MPESGIIKVEVKKPALSMAGFLHLQSVADTIGAAK
jgi:hypothetical protein